MGRTVLITDSLFVFDEHEKALQRAGLNVRRIDKPKASDEELIAGLKDADGYILGGIERLSSEILGHAQNLKAIAFTGSGYREFIPSFVQATERGIPIAAAIGGNKNSVAEYTIALILTALRYLPDLLPPGEVKFKTTRSAEDTTVGILGVGSIGARVAELCVSLGFKAVLASTRSASPVSLPENVTVVSKNELVKQSDIISLHVSAAHGTGALTRDDIDAMKLGAVLVNAAFPEAVDQKALIARLRKGEVRAAFDAPLHGDVTGIARSNLIQSNMQTAFNTMASNQRISDWVTRAMIAMLSDKDDPLIVNKDYKKYKK